MAKQQRRPDPESADTGPRFPPHGRAETLQEHRGRLEEEPAAAPMETDAESGGASAASGLSEGEAPRDPAKPYLEEQKQLSAETDASPADGWLKWVIAGLIVLALVYAVIAV